MISTSICESDTPGDETVVNVSQKLNLMTSRQNLAPRSSSSVTGTIVEIIALELTVFVFVSVI